MTTRKKWDPRIGVLTAGALAATVGLLGFTPITSAQTSAPPSHTVEVNFDSGVLFNLGNAPEVVWNDVIEIADGQWLRLEFGVLDLGFDPLTGTGSTLRIVSLEDGAEQNLNPKSARQWQNTSAYFNGDAVAIELLAYPNGQANRIVVDTVVVGEIPDGPTIESICDSIDDRALSDDKRAGRAMPIGCTAWLINDRTHTQLTAGHCAGGMTVVEFNVPLSNSNGSIRHPGPEDQYSVDPISKQLVNGGVGNDWAYFGCFENSETGLIAWEAQGDHFEMDMPTSPQSGDEIRITGYGTTGSGVPREWNQVQKTHAGPYVVRSGSSLGYRADTTGGNSGSPVIFEPTGKAVGIHTHGGCGSGGSGNNWGTGLNNAGLQNALANPKGVCKSRSCVDLTVTNLVAGQNAIFTVLGGERGTTTAVLWSTSVGSFQFEGAGWCVDFGLDLPAQRPQSQILAQGFFNQDGIFSKSVPIPGNAQGMDLAFQAAVKNTCPDDCMSDVIEETVQ